VFFPLRIGPSRCNLVNFWLLRLLVSIPVHAPADVLAVPGVSWKMALFWVTCCSPRLDLNLRFSRHGYRNVPGCCRIPLFPHRMSSTARLSPHIEYLVVQESSLLQRSMSTWTPVILCTCRLRQ